MNRFAFFSALSPLLILPGTAPSAWGGDAYQALDAGDVFVATITRVEDNGATHASPPRVWLDVQEVLRGKQGVSRSPALWQPPWHGIDYGDETLPELRRWKAAPMKGPKVGEKFILGGQAFEEVEQGKKVARYGLFAFVRIPYSDAARQQAIEQLKALEAARRQYAAEQVEAARERTSRVAAWRAAFDAETIDMRTLQADAVAIGKMVSNSLFEVERMLKGRPLMSTGGKFYLALPSDGFDPRIADFIVESRPRCVLFLSEANLIASPTQIEARLVDPYEGLVVADAAAIEGVASSLRRRPPPVPRPVLVVSSLDRAAAAQLPKAARRRWSVVVSHQFSAHGEQTADHVRQTIPAARVLVMVDRGPQQRRVRAVRIDKEKATVVYESTWSNPASDQEISVLLTAIADHAGDR